MKKTLLFTIIMLAVFAAAVISVSKKVETEWQQPQSDSIELEVSSPVEQVEKEFKVHKYQTSENFEEIYKNDADYRGQFATPYADGMLTVEQAASYCGTAIETWYPNYHFDGPFYIQLVTWPRGNDAPVYSSVYKEYADAEAPSSDADPDVIGIPKREIQCEIDAYTGKITRLNSTNYYGFDMLEEPELDEATGQQLVAKATDILKEFGHTGFEKYFIGTNSLNCSYEMVLAGQQTVVYISFVKMDGEIIFEDFTMETNADNIKETTNAIAVEGKDILQTE